MLVVKIVLGLLGLGIVVFAHELGHFLAARLVGIDVEAFSIGWGSPILKKKVGGVEYRIGMFPIGGYCKMRGEGEMREAWENGQNGVSPVKGTYFGAGPIRRIIVSFAGPFFNLVFAVLVLSIIWGAGFETRTLGNRIVLASEITGERYPADGAGLKTGDRIVEVDGKKTAYYHEVQENIAVNPEKDLSVMVERGGETVRLTVRPTLDKSSGAGKIGVYFWIDPVIGAISEGGPAARAGLAEGDRVIAVNGEAVRNSMDFAAALEHRPESLVIDYARDGVERQTVLVPEYTGEGPANSGISWALIQYRTPLLSPPAAVAKGASEAWKTLTVSLRSLRVLFKGVDLTRAVSGPVRITYMMGDTAAEGFGQGFGAGMRSTANFLALISIALCVMNLLPLPVLDGGMIVLFLVELIRRRPLNPRAAAVFQTLGVVFICGLMILAVFGDILYLVRR
jgi:regulator of sigma E protease